MGKFKVSRLLSASFFHKENSRVDGRVQDRVIVQVCPHRECVGHGAKPSIGGQTKRMLFVLLILLSLLLKGDTR